MKNLIIPWVFQVKGDLILVLCGFKFKSLNPHEKCAKGSHKKVSKLANVDKPLISTFTLLISEFV